MTRLLEKLLELYFAPKPWEKSGRLYELLGIRFFKKYMPSSGDLVRKYIWRIKFIPDGKTETLEGYETATRLFEVLHLFFIPLYIIAFGEAGMVLLGIVFNVAINVYPVMLQRYNRARLYKVLQKRSSEPEDDTCLCGPRSRIEQPQGI